MYCTKCGAKIPDESVYCLRCGGKVEKGTGYQSADFEVSSHASATGASNADRDELLKDHLRQEKSKFNRFGWGVFSAIVIAIVFIGTCNGLVSQRHQAEVRRAAIEEITSRANELLTEEESDLEDIEDLQEIIHGAMQYDELSGNISDWQDEMQRRADLIINSSYDNWRSQNDVDEIAPEFIATELRGALGFDYNNEEMSDWELLRLDFESLGVSFNTKAQELRDRIEPALESLNEVYAVACECGLSDVTVVLIEEDIDRLQESLNKISAVHARVFADIAGQADSVRDQRRLAELSRRFRSNFEEGVHTTWYKHVSVPRYVNSRAWAIYPYIGLRDGGHKWMVITLGFHRSDWIFIEHGGSITVVIDGHDHPVSYDPYLDVDTFVGGGISEWVSLTNCGSLIRAIAGGGRVVVSFSGSNGNRRIEHVLTSSEMAAFRETVEYFDLL